ncbi:msps cytoskeleton-associated protein 5 [Brevipalpus obovatus]|uniref:msps cytoskeleton-associated protein 5 n=1 Tax=Brevipalpus obovatus TaxID=246614 RepID=UPI003D9ECA84
MTSKGDDEDFSKLSLNDRLEHKNWKARVSAYEDLVKFFDIQDDKSGEFSKYMPYVKKIPIDSNVTAQEKGLAVVLSFVQKSPINVSGRVASDVLSGCLIKANLSSRAKTRELVSDIVLMYIEVEKHEIVVEEIMKCLDNKTPKIVTGAISLLRESLRQYGNKIVKLNHYGKSLASLLEHKDPSIRSEAKSLAVESYRWNKDAIKPAISSVKAVLMNELEEEFIKIKEERAKPTRLLRSEQMQPEYEDQVDEASNAESKTSTPEPETDPFDIYDPVEVLSKVPNDFMEKVESKRWGDRKEAVESILQLISPHPKLMPGDYGELVKALKKLLGKDSNVNVVSVAAKCLAELAVKLRKSFHPYAHACMVVVLEKFKEKNKIVVCNLREAIDAIILSSSLEAISEDIISALGNKNPQIRTETASFISRYCATANPIAWGSKKTLTPIVEALVKDLNYNDPSVRDASAEALGTIMKVMGEKTMAPYFADIDALKMAKIKENYDKAEVKFTAPVSLPQAKTVRSQATRSAGQQPPPPTSSMAPPKKIPSKVAPKKVIKPDVESKQPQIKPKTLPKPKSRTGFTSKPDSSSENFTAPLLPANNMKEQRINDEKALKILKWNFTTPREEFFTLLKEQMIAANWNESLVTNCFHSNFKFHLKAIESLTDFLNQGNVEATLLNSDLILKWFALRFFDTNPSVILKALEYLIKLFQAFQESEQKVSELDGQSFIPYLIQKTGDPKDIFRQKVHEIIEILKNIYPPQRLFSFIVNGLSSKNARQRATCLDELSYLIATYGLSVCQPSPSEALKSIGKQIGDKDKGVREAALNCAVAAFQMEGEKVYKLIGNIPEKDMDMLEERIKRKKPLRTASEKTLLKTDEEKRKENTPLIRKIASESVLRSEQSNDRVPRNEIIKHPYSKTSPMDEDDEPAIPSIRVAPMSALRAQNPYRDEDAHTPPVVSNLSRKLLNSGTITKQRPLGLNTPGFGSPFRRPDQENGFKREDTHPEERFTPAPRFNRSGTYGMNNGNDLSEDDSRHEVENEDPRSEHPIAESSKRLSFSRLNQPSPRLIEFSPAPPSSDRSLRLASAYISQLSSTDFHSAFQTATQLHIILKQAEKARTHFSDKVDHLVLRYSLQHKYILQKHLDDANISREEIVDFLKILNLSLTLVFGHEVLRKLITRDVLKELIGTVISLLLDDRVGHLPDSSNIIKSTNQLANAIISFSDPTNMLSALINLLQESILERQRNSRPLELVMKCIWKMSRVLDYFINDLWVDKVLSEIHCFFERFPPEYWKTGDGADYDVPMRTVKTVIFLIIKNLQDKIFEHLTLVPNVEKTELFVYMQKALRQVRSERSSNSLQSKRSSVQLPGLSAQDALLLKSIINKLGTPNNEEGFQMLRDFCDKRPTFSQQDLQNYLHQTSSEFFVTFVLEGLTKAHPSDSHNGSHDKYQEPCSGVQMMTKVNQSYSISSKNESIVAEPNSCPSLSSNYDELTAKSIKRWFKSSTGLTVEDDFHNPFARDHHQELHTQLLEDSKIAKLQVELMRQRSQRYLQ